MQQINIHYYTKAGGEKKVIPVMYAVEQHEADPCRQIIHCHVGLPKAEMPKWLHPQTFDLMTHISDDINVVEYDTSRDTELRTLDAEFFRYKVYSEILFRELKKLSKKQPNC